MRISINCCLVVITSFAIARLVSSHMFSMAFMSGEFPGQGKTEKFFSQKCSNTSGFVAQCRVMHKNVFVIIREHSLPCGSNRVSSTRLYWSCFIVPSTMLRCPMPLAEMTDHTMTLTRCLTLSTRQSAWNYSPGRRLTKELLSTKIWKVDSSAKHL